MIWRLIRERLRRAWMATVAGARAALRRSGPALRACWALVRPVLARSLGFLLALVIVFEEWGWQPLAELLGRLARWRPWAAIEALIIRLPPYAALLVFVLPTALLLPLKLAALFLVAKGQIVLAGLLFVLAKVVATALVARLFLLTQPALMQIGWFARAHDTVLPWKDALVARVHASWAWRVGRVWKQRVRRVLAAQARRWRPTLDALRATLRVAADRTRTRALKLLRQIRERWATLR
jgi:hypothetical protein